MWFVREHVFGLPTSPRAVIIDDVNGSKVYCPLKLNSKVYF